MEARKYSSQTQQALVLKILTACQARYTSYCSPLRDMSC